MRLLPLSLTSFLVTCSLAAWVVHPTEPAASPEPVQIAPRIAASPEPVQIAPRIAAADLPWAPPDWLAADARPELWAIGDMDGSGEGGEPGEGRSGITLASRSAFAFDLDSGEILLDKRADDPYPVASLTKLVSALTLFSDEVDLDASLCITTEMWPGWPGASSKFNTGVCTHGWDVLGAALVKSDNRAAYALGHLGPDPATLFVEHMNQVAVDLGMASSVFVDPSGSFDENLATARDLTKAVTAVAFHPVLGFVSSAPFWDTDVGSRVRRLGTTNKLIGRDDLVFLAAKTGYTDTARHCFSGVVETASGRRVALTLLGAPKSSSRWADVRRIVDRFQ